MKSNYFFKRTDNDPLMYFEESDSLEHYDPQWVTNWGVQVY